MSLETVSNKMHDGNNIMAIRIYWSTISVAAIFIPSTDYACRPRRELHFPFKPAKVLSLRQPAQHALRKSPNMPCAIDMKLLPPPHIA